MIPSAAKPGSFGPFAQLFLFPQVTTGHDPVLILKGDFGISGFGVLKCNGREKPLTFGSPGSQNANMA
jgi:hypothetical protein